MRTFHYLLIACVFVSLFSCKHEKKEVIKDYSYSPKGYYYRLLAFNENNRKPGQGDVVWLDAVFRNLKDSVFWDSKHDASGKFLMRITDSSDISKHLFELVEGDSMSYYFRTKDFFRLYFRTDSVPIFCEKDSLVKADLKLKKIMDETAWLELQNDLSNTEKREIESYLQTAKGWRKDSLGVIWLEHKKNNNEPIVSGTSISISYKGFFLDGKLIDNSGGNFSFSYGTPDQLLKGLNFVIKKMRKGEYVKIILPSWLAYGESGSSNGAVPPFTPLLYEIKIKD